MEKGHVITKNSIGLFFMPGEKDLRTFYTRRNIEADGGIVLDGPMTFRYNRTCASRLGLPWLQEDRHGVLVGWKMDLWTYEREQWNSGLTALCGVDEAGAGPLAGPVYAAAVILPREIDFPGLNDSKKLTAKKREVLFDADHRHGRGVQRAPL